MIFGSGVDLSHAAAMEQAEINGVRETVLDTKLDEERADNSVGVMLSIAQQAVARLTSSR